MDKREKIIRRWFDMWLQKKDTGIEALFSQDAVYIESWGPEYRGIEKIRHWFAEWNTRGSVLAWDIRGFFHKEDQTVAQWYFRNAMDDGRMEEFDGMTLVRWSEMGQICFLQEFGCNLNRYDPYAGGDAPHFAGDAPKWF